MTQLKTQVLGADAEAFACAAEILMRGGLVSFPTETVYGLGADATNDRAVASIYQAKGRPSFNPLIIHLAEASWVSRYCTMTPMAERLAAAFWPGAITLVVPIGQNSEVSKLVTAGLDTVAVRVPDHPIASSVLRAFGGAVAAPSANLSGRVSPTEAAHVLSGLSGKIDAVVDGGACAIGVESTIVDCTGEVPVLLRAGGIPAEAIEACLGVPLMSAPKTETPNSPGQLTSHYAPTGSIRLNVWPPEPHETGLGFGEKDAQLNLSPTGDLAEAASNLFSMLHELDRMGAKHIAVAPIPAHGLGQAINDRLRRAAAPRD